MKHFVTWGIFCIIVTTFLALFIKFNPIKEEKKIGVKENMTIRHIAERNDVPIQDLIPLLPLEKRTNTVTTLLNLNKPINELALDKPTITQTISKSKEKGFPVTDVLRYILWSIWLLFAGIILIRRKNIRKIRIIWLVATLTIFGIILGAAPNPMEAFVKLHKIIKGIPGNPLVFVITNFIIFSLLSIIGTRMLCSWGCQLGALQESFFNIPLFKKIKKNYKLPFSASIAIRITVYLVFFLLFFQLLNLNQGGPGSIFYHHFNLFKIYDFYDLALFTIPLIPILIVSSLVIYRPFCQTLCPFGIWSWILDNIAIYKVRKINFDDCVECRECENSCPTEAMKAINQKQLYFRPDCWSCGNCIEVCKLNLMQFTSAKQAKKLSKKRFLEDMDIQQPPIKKPEFIT